MTQVELAEQFQAAEAAHARVIAAAARRYYDESSSADDVRALELGMADAWDARVAQLDPAAAAAG